ncbi:MAG: PKD domain-containing protein, partial [Anaerolineales bacterium]
LALLWLSDLPPDADPFELRNSNNWLAARRSAYTTAAYAVDAFETLGASLSNKYSHQAQDSDQDGLIDTLVVATRLDVDTPGTYSLEAELANSRGQMVARASWTGSDGEASLQFQALLPDVTPYYLQNVRLYDANGGLIDSDAAGEVRFATARDTPTYTTGSLYGFRLDSPGAASVLPQVTEAAGVDRDGDGTFDELNFEVETTLAAPGQYRLEGWLESADGFLVAWATSDPVTLEAGSQSLSLSFDGRAINAQGIDGPYKLVALKVLFGDDYTVIDEIDVAYRDGDFTFGDFESGQRGKIDSERHVRQFSAASSSNPCAAFITSSPDYINETTSFFNLSAGDNLSFQWDFGDGSLPSSVVSPTHTYASPGTFTVVLTASNDLAFDVASDIVVIQALPTPTPTPGPTVEYTFCSTPGLTIPQQGTVSSQLVLTQSLTLGDLDLSINANHSYISDLVLTLRHEPSGASLTLLDRPGIPASQYGCSRDDLNATFDDEAVLPAEGQCASPPPAIGGDVLPLQALSLFDGQSLSGTWTLQVSDLAAYDGGSLNQWCLIATAASPPTPTATPTATATPLPPTPTFTPTPGGPPTPTATNTPLPPPTATPTPLPPPTPTPTATPTPASQTQFCTAPGLAIPHLGSISSQLVLTQSLTLGDLDLS